MKVLTLKGPIFLAIFVALLSKIFNYNAPFLSYEDQKQNTELTLMNTFLVTLNLKGPDLSCRYVSDISECKRPALSPPGAQQ